MAQDFRYKFCQLCKNCRTNIENGYYCGLTMKKPDFSATCQYFDLDDQKVLAKRAKIQEEIQATFRLFEWNSFSGNRYVVKILQKYLPDRFTIKRFPFEQYLISPIMFFALFIISLVISIPVSLKFWISAPLLLITIIVAYQNYNSLIKKGEKVATLDRTNLTLSTGQKVKWSDILLVYVYSNFFRPSKLRIQKVFDSDIIEIDIKNTLGKFLILNIVESYRKKIGPKTR